MLLKIPYAFTVSVTLIFSLALNGQDSCYLSQLYKGIDLFRLGHYKEAIDRFHLVSRKCSGLNEGQAEELQRWTTRSEAGTIIPPVDANSQEFDTIFLKNFYMLYHQSGEVDILDLSDHFDDIGFRFDAAKIPASRRDNSSNAMIVREMDLWKERAKQMEIELYKQFSRSSHNSLAQALALTAKSLIDAAGPRRDTNALILSFAAKRIRDSIWREPSIETDRIFHECAVNYFTRRIKTLDDSEWFRVMDLAGNNGLFIESKLGRVLFYGYDYSEQQGPTVLYRHRDHLTNVFYNAKEKALATSSGDSTSVVLYPSGGRERIELKGIHQGATTSTYFSEGHRKILVTSKDSTFSLFGEDGEKIWQSPKINGQVLQGAISESDPGYLFVRTPEPVVRLWDFEGNQLTPTAVHDSYIRLAFFSGKSPRLYTGGDDGTVRTVDVITGDTMIFRHSAAVRNFQVTKDEKHLLVVTVDGAAFIWDLPGRNRTSLEPSGHITNAQFDNSGEKIIACASDSTARISNLEGQLIREFRLQSKPIDLQISKSGDYFLTTSEAGVVKLWSRAEPEYSILERNVKANRAGAGVLPAFFSADGNWIIIPDGKASEILVFPLPSIALKHLDDNKAVFKNHAEKLEKDFLYDFARLWKRKSN